MFIWVSGFVCLNVFCLWIWLLPRLLKLDVQYRLCSFLCLSYESSLLTSKFGSSIGVKPLARISSLPALWTEAVVKAYFVVSSLSFHIDGVFPCLKSLSSWHSCICYVQTPVSLLFPHEETGYAYSMHYFSKFDNNSNLFYCSKTISCIALSMRLKEIFVLISYFIRETVSLWSNNLFALLFLLGLISHFGGIHMSA